MNKRSDANREKVFYNCCYACGFTLYSHFSVEIEKPGLNASTFCSWGVNLV